MANRDTANLVKAQAILLGAFQSSELRCRFPATYLALRANSPIMFPNYDILRTREDRTVETNYKLRSSRTLGTGRSHNHTGVKGDTGVLTPTWTTYNDKFSISLKQADNSVYNSLEQQYADEILNTVSNFMEGYETSATNYLFNNRSGVNIATAEGNFNATENTFEITATTNSDRSIQITQIAMDANKYPAGLDVFCDSISFALFQYQAAQGASNQTNLSFQFQGVNFIHSVELGALASGLAAAYRKGFWLAVPRGTVATLPWIPKQNREGVVTQVNMYSSLLNPIDGEAYAVHEYETRADDTANNGYTQDVVTQVEISQDLAFAKAPLSTANETTIQAFALI